MNKALIDALEDCLERIKAGDSLEQVLSLYPQWADDLRPMLAAAQELQALQYRLAVPASAQASSRMRLLVKAQSASQARRGWLLPGFFGRVPALVASLAAVVILVLGTGIASAAAVPGDVLYPVKLAREQTQLLFVTDPLSRLELQQSFDQERADETEALIEHGRASEITLSGTLTRAADGLWMVAKINVVLSTSLEREAVALQNSYVDVHGVLQSNGSLQAESIILRQIEFSGVLQNINGDQWMVSRVPLLVDQDTNINGSANLGDDIRVKATRREDGTLVAHEIDGHNLGQNVNTEANPTRTPGEIEDFTQTPVSNPTLGQIEDLAPSPTVVTPPPESTQKLEPQDATEIKPAEATPVEVTPTRAEEEGHTSSTYRSPTPTPGNSEDRQPPESTSSDDQSHEQSPTPAYESGPTTTPTPGED